MNNKLKHIRIGLLGIKSLLYRIISFLFQTVILWLCSFGSLSFIQISLILSVQKTLVYLCYDILFAKTYNVTKEEGCVIWATGASGVGKSTLMDALEKELIKYNKNIERLDGDIVRESLCSDLGFSKEDRDTNIKRVTFVSKLLSRNRTIVLASFVSPYRETRKNIRNNTTNFIELYLTASKEELIKRDPKGLYKKAINGEIKGLTGYDGVYEEPDNPEIIIDTEKISIEDSVQIILKYLKQEKFI